MNITNCTTCTTPMGILQPEAVLTYERVVQIALHTFIFVGGLLGNLFVVTVILQRKKMQTITNWFVFNLAISDLAIILLVITTTNFVPFIDWPFGEIACKYLITPVLEHFAGVCVLTHTALSMARYMIVHNAMRGTSINLMQVRVVIASIWAVAFLTMSATLMGLFGKFVLVHSPYNGLLTCRILWVDPKRQLIYRAIVFVTTYVVPMVATGFAYYQIHMTVASSIKHLKGHTSVEVLSKRRRKSRRMNRVLMTMYITFGITTLPLQVLYFLTDLNVIPSVSFVRIIWLLFIALFYAQVVTNPLVLFYMGEDYRKELYKLPLCFCVKSPKFRRMSYAFRSSFKGHIRMYKKRNSTVNQNKRKSTLAVSKNSNERLFITQNNNLDILQSARLIPTEDDRPQNVQNFVDYELKCQNECPAGHDYNVGFYECQLSSQNDDDDQTNDDNASSFLYYTESPRSSTYIEMIKDKYWTENNINQQESLLFCNNQSSTPKRVSNQSCNSTNLGSQLKSNSTELLSDENDCKKYSNENRDTKFSTNSLSAYYDDGTLYYVYDSTFGKISFENDDGRETIL